MAYQLLDYTDVQGHLSALGSDAKDAINSFLAAKVSGYGPNVQANDSVVAVDTSYEAIDAQHSAEYLNFIDVTGAGGYIGGSSNGLDVVVDNGSTAEEIFVGSAGSNSSPKQVFALGSGGDTLNLASVLPGSQDTVYSGSGALVYLGGNTTIYGGSGGNNTFEDGSGANVSASIVGAGKGNTFHLYTGTNTIYAGDGADTISLNGGTNTVTGNAISATTGDEFDISGGLNTIHAGFASDQINITGGSGSFASAHNEIYLGGGADTVSVRGDSNNIIHVDPSTGTNSANNISLQFGQNTVYGGMSGDAEKIAVSGSANLSYIGGTGNDTLYMSLGTSNTASISGGSSLDVFDIAGTHGSFSIAGANSNSNDLLILENQTFANAIQTVTGTTDTITFHNNDQTLVVSNEKAIYFGADGHGFDPVTHKLV